MIFWSTAELVKYVDYQHTYGHVLSVGTVWYSAKQSSKLRYDILSGMTFWSITIKKGSLRINHRWARLLKQQSSITFIVCRQRKTNFSFLFAANTNGSCHLLFLYMFKQQHIQKTQHHIYICIWTYAAILNRKWKTEAQVIFLNPFYRLLIMQAEVCCFSVCSPGNKRKLSICKWLNLPIYDIIIFRYDLLVWYSGMCNVDCHLGNCHF